MTEYHIYDNSNNPSTHRVVEAYIAPITEEDQKKIDEDPTTSVIIGLFVLFIIGVAMAGFFLKGLPPY